MVLGSSYSPYGRRVAPPRIPVIVYGTRWCAQTQMVRRYLERLGVGPDARRAALASHRATGYVAAP